MTPRRWLTIFAAILLATAVALGLGLLHAMQVVRQPGYPESTGDASVQLQDSAFTLKDTACDIVIDGDSTANVGIDPRLIAQQTRLKACNIATNRPVVDDLGTLPLDAFLAHNPKPRLIVFEFGPEIFFRAKAAARWEHNGPFSPMVMLSRDLPAGEALKVMLQHPAETTQFVLYIAQNELLPRTAGAERDAEYKRMIAHAAESNGQLDLGFPAISNCSGTPRTLYGPVDAAWVRQLHTRYQAQGIAVLVLTSPIPGCDPRFETYKAGLAGVTDNALGTLPIGDFVAGYRHTTQAGSQLETQQVIDVIRQREPQLLPVR